MPSQFLMTSPVAVASTRILTAYLSNHRLSLAEAASLGERIGTTLASLVADKGPTSGIPLALVEEAAPRQQARTRASRRTRKAPSTVTTGIDVAASTAEQVAEPVAEPVAIASHESEGSPLPVSEPTGTPHAEGLAEAASVEDVPRKRKRPSRPRSKRGKALSAAPGLQEAMAAEEPDDRAPGTGTAAAR